MKRTLLIGLLMLAVSTTFAQKKIKIAVIITIAALILAGIGGAALVNTLKNKKAEMNALKDKGASGDIASGDNTPTNKETEGNSLADPATQAQVQDQAQISIGILEFSI